MHVYPSDALAPESPPPFFVSSFNKTLSSTGTNVCTLAQFRRSCRSRNRNFASEDVFDPGDQTFSNDLLAGSFACANDECVPEQALYTCRRATSSMRQGR